MFRRVELPGSVKGRLYLHSMPGRYENLDSVWAEIKRLRISALVQLAPMDEIREKSLQYAEALDRATVPCAVWPCPICDYQGPDNDNVFIEKVMRAANSLRAGEGILVHCGAGVGRTGLFAVSILMTLGATESEARGRVAAAGSRPERTAQEDALRRLASRLQKTYAEDTPISPPTD